MKVASYLKLSVAVAVATMALKTAAWWFTGSVGLLSDAMESLVNLAGAMFALAMVTLAAQPPDEDQPLWPPQGRVLLERVRGGADLGGGRWPSCGPRCNA